MATNVKCTNPECGAVFEVQRAEVGDTVVCPECGSEVEVRGELGDEFEARAGQGPDEEGKVWHPARQQCPNCGAVLGVRAVFCPECGADIRTGAVAEVGEVKRKFDFTPFLIGGGVIVALGVLVVLVVFAVNLIGRRKQEAQQAAEPVMEQPVARVAAPAEQEVVIPEFEMPQQLLSQLAVQEEAERKVVGAYLERLRETLGRVRTAEPEEMARSWAELYAYCLDNGLQSEAEQCWYQAVRLRPTSPEVNAALGRTDTFEGKPVTPEQKGFLEVLRARLQIVNQDPQLDGHAVRVSGLGQTPLPLGAVARFRPEPGELRVELVRTDEPDSVDEELSLTVQAGLEYLVELRTPLSVSELPFEPLANIYNAVEGGQAVEGVRVERNAQGDILSAEAGPVRLAGSQDRPLKMQFGARGGDLTVMGSMTVGDPYGDEGQVALYGSSRRPLRLAVDSNTRTVGLVSGTYCKLRADLAPGLWGALGTAEGDFASEWARRKISAYADDVERENAEAEADGRLRGEWEAQEHALDRLTEFRRTTDEVLNYQQKAWRQPHSKDRARALGLQDRQQYLYLNWPRFRASLAAMTEGSYAGILGQLEAMGGTAQSSAREGERRGPATGPPRMGTAPTGPGGRPSYGQRAAQRVPRSPLHPDPVVLDGDARLYALMKILPLLPDSVALAQVRENVARLVSQDWIAAIVSLEAIGTPEVVDYLGQLSQEAPATDIVTASLLSLGVIGTPEALEYCDNPAVLPAVRTASMAAKAIAGDPEALDKLPEFLAGADVKTKGTFLDFVSGVDTPASVLVLSDVIDAYSDAKSQAAVAEALARIGGRVAMAELARLLDKSNEAFPDALADVDEDEGLLLVRPLGQLVNAGKGGKEAAELLARMQSEAAFAYLKGGMLNSSSKDALRALLENGSPDALETAVSGAHLADIEALQYLNDAWFEVDEEAGTTAWRETVDSEHGGRFLDAVVTQSREPKVRIAAAMMLEDVGQPPSVATLAALAKEAKPKGAVAPERRRRPGPPMGPPRAPEMGPPGGAPFGPPGARPQASAGPYQPGGFQQPEGEPIVPKGFQLDAKPQLYALGLLMQRGGEEAEPQLQQLAESYESLEFRTAAMRALGATAVEGALAFLRQRATARKQEYADVAEVTAELQDRLAALQALGVARDTAFLPQLYDALHETPPHQDEILKVDRYEDLSAWWQVQLWTGACNCLSEICRHRQLIELTADSQLQKEMARRLIELLEQPGPDRPSIADAREELKAAALRAFGRCASLHEESEALVLKRLAMSLRPAQQQGGAAAGRPARGTAPVRSARGTAPVRSPRGTAPTAGPRRRTGGGRQPQVATLRTALRDALVHMAVRGEGLGVLDEIPGVLPTSGAADAGWNRLIQELGEAPTPEYFQLVNRVFNTLTWEARQAVLGLSKGGPAAYGAGYALFVAKMIKEPVAEDEELPREATSTPVAARTLGAPATDMPPEAIAAREAAEREAAAAERAGAGVGVPEYAWRPAVTAEEEIPLGTGYKRTGVYRRRPWSYSLRDLPQTVSHARKRWSLIELLFQSSSMALEAALQEEQLMRFSEFGPAIGTLYVAQTPEARPKVVSELAQMLAPAQEAAAATPIGPGFAAAPALAAAAPARPVAVSAKTKRTAVAALRRLGGEDAIAALFVGLVGPPVAQQTAVGAAGMQRPRPADEPPEWVRALAASRQPAQGGVPSTTAAFIARALGSMGQAELLRQALNAPGRRFFLQDSATVQKAALEGMAYLPAEQKPVELLGTLLIQARTLDLRKAVADAILTAVRRLGASSAEVSAS